MINSFLQVNIGTEFGSPIGDTITVGNLVTVFLSAGITIAGIIMLFLLVGGGLKIVQGAGSGDKQSTAQGKQAVTWALIGFIIVLAAYWIIRILETITGSTFLTGPTLPV